MDTAKESAARLSPQRRVLLCWIILGLYSLYKLLEKPRFTSPSWVQKPRWPFYIASAMYIVMALMELFVLRVFPYAAFWFDKSGAKIQQSLRAHFIATVSGAILYTSYSLFDQQVLCTNMSGDESHLLMRNVYWTLSTPLQWFAFSSCFTTANTKQMTIVYFSCLSTQVCGILALLSCCFPMKCFFIALAVVAFAVMFRQVFFLPLARQTASIAHHSRIVCLCLWVCFPCVVLGRLMCGPDLTSIWSEQVLLLTLLDVSAKLVTFSSIIVARAVLTFDTATHATMVMQLVHANDWVIVVDSNFMPVRHLVLTHLLPEAFTKHGLLELCMNTNYQNMLRFAAFKADTQPFHIPQPKCKVVFSLGADEGEVLAECFVSKSQAGRRAIAVAVLGISNGNQQWEPPWP
eukprot:gnl/TRDRNA2_/TRDRNA2_176641_c0_seq2.p1 gnl/TRDRNA2_/TRDRNA2_176641_c0~~gnl/TRDRNA2_/TRDRNA2_176641_c0_seq2.p1  ORF type:complete len:404 (+),score=24.54 gnl/TRDRNA2_/TRDRNA2_176641_c0_seq2:83-1294(+)